MPILSALYIAPIFHIFKKRTKNLLCLIQVSTLSFVDNSLLISQEKSYGKSNANLFCSYNIISSLFNQFRLVIEHDKSEIFHFSRLIKNIQSPSLDLRLIGGPLLYLKNIWQYLGFFFDKKLLFHYHVHHYANKALSTIKGMKMLENSNKGLSPIYKQLLYRTCVFLIYRVQLWYFKGAPFY